MLYMPIIDTSRTKVKEWTGHHCCSYCMLQTIECDRWQITGNHSTSRCLLEYPNHVWCSGIAVIRKGDFWTPWFRVMGSWGGERGHDCSIQQPTNGFLYDAYTFTIFSCLAVLWKRTYQPSFWRVHGTRNSQNKFLLASHWHLQFTSYCLWVTSSTPKTFSNTCQLVFQVYW